MAGNAICVVRSGAGGHHDIALNYTQLSLDYGETSRLQSEQLHYYITDEFQPHQFQSYNWTLVVPAGVIMLWGAFQLHLLPLVESSDARHILLSSGVRVYRPGGSGVDRMTDRYITSLVVDTPGEFLSSHGGILTDIIDDSNISYLVHNEIPVLGEVAGPLDWAVTVSSGFFINHVLEHHGYHHNTEIFHIDISKISLQTRRYTIENWDGEDLPRWIEHLNRTFPSMALWNRKKYTSMDNNYQRIWQDTQRYFGDNWAKHWKSYKNMRHSYVRLNIASSGTKPLLKKIPGGNGAIWWDGSLKRLPSNVLLDSHQSHHQAIQFVSSLTSLGDHVICYGSDHCNQQYDGLPVESVLREIAYVNSREELWRLI